MNISALEKMLGKVPPYPSQQGQYETEAIRQFADDNNFQYALRDPKLVQYAWTDARSTPAWLGMTGIAATKDAYHVVSGSDMGYPLSMFLLWDDMVDGFQYSNPTKEQEEKFTKQQTTGIVCVQLPKTFPQVVLDSSKNDRIRSSVGTEYDSSQRLALEGDFPDYFDLYAPIGLQVNVLTLLAPNMMQILKNHSELFDVEFYGNEMVLIVKAPLYDPNVMKAVDEALTVQLGYLNRLLLSWNYTPIHQPFDLLKKPFVIGRVMKVGGLRIPASVQLCAILLLFVFFGIMIVVLNRIFPNPQH